MAGTTSISDLPIGNQNISNRNIQLQTREQTTNNSQMQSRTELDNSMSSANQSPPNPHEYMKQVVSDVQAASVGGNLNLPSRDIPTETVHITQDQQIKTNYIPENTEDYIQKFQTPQELVDINAKKEETKTKYERLFDDLQIPILIFVLYFVFQLPIVNKTIGTYLPLLFNKDGNANMKGYVFNGLLMAAAYCAVTKSMEFLSV